MRFLKMLLVVAMVSMLTAGCALAGGIFKGGFIIGIIIAVIVLGLIFKMFGGRGA